MPFKGKILHVMIAAVAAMTLIGSAQAQFDSLRKFTGTAEPSKKIAHFEIKGALVETPIRVPPLFADEAPVSVKSLLARFKEARQDDSVVAVVLDLQNAAMGAGQLEEVHQAIRRFAAADKEVFVHADMLMMLTYAAATASTHISLVPTGDLWLPGLYGEAPYLRGTLDKIGVMADFEQCGDFKTASEPLTRTGPSEAAKQMNEWLLDSLYESLVEIMANGRGLAPEKIRELIDHGLFTADQALAAGLIDSVRHRQDFIADLKARYGASVEFATDYGQEDFLDMPQDNIFAVFEFLMKMMSPTPAEYHKPTIAVVYVEGVIMPGEAETSPFGSTSGAFSTTIRKALDKAAANSAIKAVVLRVDSPGGSALASEIILDATRRVRAKKPLVVSMGNVAGSGGYYVACDAETIFADRTTITASIGVLGGKLVTTGMWDKLGVNWHAQQRGALAAMMSSAAPFSDQERARIREYLDTVYDVFKRNVTEGRGDRLAKPIDQIAGGRVFTGAQALELGLVDKIGGLDDAIKYAANRARVGEYEIRVIPEPPGIFDMLMGGAGDDEFARSSRVIGLSLLDWPVFQATLPALAKVDPLRVRAMIRALQRLELIHREGVVMIMPAELLIR